MARDCWHTESGAEGRIECRVAKPGKLVKRLMLERERNDPGPPANEGCKERCCLEGDLAGFQLADSRSMRHAVTWQPLTPATTVHLN